MHSIIADMTMLAVDDDSLEHISKASLDLLSHSHVHQRQSGTLFVLHETKEALEKS